MLFENTIGICYNHFINIIPAAELKCRLFDGYRMASGRKMRIDWLSDGLAIPIINLQRYF